MQRRLVHLPQRGRMRGLFLERRKPIVPTGSKFASHPTLHERPAHGRRLGLQLAEFGSIFGRQEIRDGRHHLSNLHQRPLGLAQSGCKRLGDALIALVAAKQRVGGKADASPGQVCAHARGADKAPAQSVAFRIGRVRRIGHASDIGGFAGIGRGIDAAPQPVFCWCSI